MKKLLMILSASLFLVACGGESSESCDKENCTKECSEKGHKDCKKDCDKSCKKGEEKHEKCGEDCKKECCAGKKKEGDKEEMGQLEIGTVNPSLDVKMKDISGTEYTLTELAKENGLLVIFSCNTCPFVVGRPDGSSQGWENRYNDVQKWADDYKIGFVLVNSNEAKRGDVDSFEEMKKHAADKGYKNIKYVVDANHVVADAYGARTTPHVYLFDKENKLVYRGAIDDNVDKKEEVKEQYLANAMKNLAEGAEITTNVTKNMGCSIKRVIKEEAAH